MDKKYDIKKYSYSFTCKCGYEVNVSMDYKHTKITKCFKCRKK